MLKKSFKHYVFNFNWLLLERLIQIFGGLFISVWVARYLGPGDYGILNYAIAYTGLYLLLVKLGLDEVVVRELVAHPECTNQCLGTAFALKLAGAIIAIFLIALSLYFMAISNISKVVILITAAGFIFQSVDVIDYFYQSKVMSKYSMMARNSAFIVVLLIKSYLIVAGFSILYFALANLILFILTFIFLIYIYLRNGYSVLAWRYSPTLAKKIVPILLAFGNSIISNDDTHAN
jgi:O-antigen/teichoic acid export membrane protein